MERCKCRVCGRNLTRSGMKFVGLKGVGNVCKSCYRKSVVGSIELILD